MIPLHRERLLLDHITTHFSATADPRRPQQATDFYQISPPGAEFNPVWQHQFSLRNNGFARSGTTASLGLGRKRLTAAIASPLYVSLALLTFMQRLIGAGWKPAP
jgi:hypothetical protein